MSEMKKGKCYLGDSVYAQDDGYMIVLTTENGFGPTNTIYLEPEVIENLIAFIAKVRNLRIDVRRKSAQEEMENV